MRYSKKKEEKLLDEEETFLFFYSRSIYIHSMRNRGRVKIDIRHTMDGTM